jgi:peptide/nickel transport system substrate-binding protein
MKEYEVSKKGQNQEEISRLMSEYRVSGISRREFMKRALILGLSMPAATSFLANAAPALAKGAVSQSPVKGGTFVEGYDRDFQKVEPIAPGWDDPTLCAVYEYPLIRDPNGKPVPMVAESWKVSDDGKTWTFKIRDGLKFHSGAPCTNAQIVQNFNAFRDEKLGQNAVFWVSIDTITASDGNTVVVKMKTPFAAFPETLATENSMICNMDARNKAPDTFGSTTADGTGPFTLEKYAPGDSVEVTRWDAYPGSIVPFVQNKGPA